MKGLFRLFGAVVLGCFALVAVSVTFSFIKQNWFGKIGAAGKHYVAVLDLSGAIWTSNAFLKQTEEILENPNAKAVVLRINSPGGSVGPSQEIYEAIKKLDAKIPVVATMGSVAASGGYYAAIGARKIYANPGTLTGSIGVIMEFMNTERLLDWAKLERYTLKAGKMKDVGSPLRKMTTEERAFLQALLLDIHQQFRGAVKERRKLTDAEIEMYADGRVLSGNQAKAAKLVDELGGFDAALKEAKLLAKLPEDADVEFPQKHKGLLKELLLGGDDTQEGESRLGSFFRLLMTSERPGWRVLLLAPLS